MIGSLAFKKLRPFADRGLSFTYNALRRRRELWETVEGERDFSALEQYTYSKTHKGRARFIQGRGWGSAGGPIRQKNLAKRWGGGDG
jgi:hypothetical protein